ncbi:hypothetical protein [Polyangium aurulentum]|uniref:hypothetical protein n=1 Tax=Polyangium aurulentum TaxID=2567896 RepID=UPI00146DB9E0|nr:hypothetical protein [Polyangium aurulentum]UQA57246.1 hypothetical protein E8A73_039065 [Polyangium aurulentum]
MRSPSLLSLAVLLAAAGCADPGPDPTTAYGFQEPPWLILRVDGVQVSPTRSDQVSPWDGATPEPTDDTACGVLRAIGAVLPIEGSGAPYLCQIDTRPPTQPLEPTAPDLLVVLAVGQAAHYQSYTARDTFQHTFGSEFLLPTNGVPSQGLTLAVLDRDGDRSEPLGVVRVTRQELLAAAAGNPLIVRADPRIGLQKLELAVFPYGLAAENVETTLDVRSGTMPVPFRNIRAGEIVEVAASGQYRVSSASPWIDPRGYPGGSKTGNFVIEPFKSGPHGSALALVGQGDAKMGAVAAPCARFVAPVSGPLVVGINDAAPYDGEGSAQFQVRVTAPVQSEWLDARTSSDCGQW